MTIPRLQDYALPQQQALPDNKVSWPFDRSRAALLIHDMQDYFLDFWAPDSPLINQVVDNIAHLRSYCKSVEIPVFYTAQPVEQHSRDRGLLNDMWGPGISRYPDRQGIVAALAPDNQDRKLVKWRYSAFQRSDFEQQLQQAGRDQLIICGVYAHIGCLTTALDAFMRNIQPFMVADALADFSAEDHLMALRYCSGCCGRVVMTEDIASRKIGSKQALRQQIMPLLEAECGEPQDNENLIDYGLDSLRIMQLASRWHGQNPQINFVALAKNPTIESWWNLLAQGDKA